MKNVNSERGESFSQFDVRVAKDLNFTSSLGVELIAEVFNLFNDSNPAGIISNGTATTYAGDPLQGEQRLIQLGARFHF